MESLYLSFSVVAPLCIYMLIGVAAHKLNMIDQPAVSKMNKVIFRLLFPVMMFNNVRSAGDKLKNADGYRMIGFLLIVISVQFLLLCLLTPVFIKSKPRQASFIQGCFRSNSVLFALPVVTSLCGEENIGVAAMCVAVIVPYYNVLCVIVLEVKRGGKVKFGKLMKGIITNPLVEGAIAGILVTLFDIPIPAMLDKPITALSSMATPISLILLGAALRFEGIRKDIRGLITVDVVKLVAVPFIVTVGGYLLGYRGVELASLFALSCVPTAVSSYPMAEQMGADGPFAGEIVAFTTVSSILTVFLWTLVLSSIGWV